MPTYDYQLTWTEAANALADVMAAENKALAARDAKSLALLQDAKQIAVKRAEFAYLAGPKLEMRRASARIDRLNLERERLLERRNTLYGTVAGLIAPAASYVGHLWHELHAKSQTPIPAHLPPELSNIQAPPIKVRQPAPVLERAS